MRMLKPMFVLGKGDASEHLINLDRAFGRIYDHQLVPAMLGDGSQHRVLPRDCHIGPCGAILLKRSAVVGRVLHNPFLESPHQLRRFSRDILNRRFATAACPSPLCSHNCHAVRCCPVSMHKAELWLVMQVPARTIGRA